ncbi:MAG: hypothetical protein IKP35_00915 [Alphaproteobacteria bacterium]|nr:hypothetical protein [Alphaproteobacteria bacterium]
MDATKQNKLTSTGANANITVSGSGNVITDITAADGAVTVTKGSIAATDYIKNGTNALDLTMASGESKDSMAPSITAVEGMKTTSVAEAGSTSNVKVPTETAVRSAIDTLNAALSGNIDAIKGLFEEGMGETAMEAYASWVEDGKKTSGEKYDALIAAIAADPKYHNVVTDDAKDHQNLIPRNSNITKGIAYALGTGIEHHTSNFDIDTEGVADKTDAAWEKIKHDKATDDYVPTVAAVERRVERAVTQAGNNISKETNNVLTSHANNTAQNGNDNKLTTVAAIAATTKYAAGTAPTAASGRWQTTDSTATATYASDRDLTTQKAVTQQFEALDQSTYGSNTATTGTGAVTMPVTAVTQTDGLITASRGKITFNDAMDAGLSNVNVSGSNYSSSCTASNPCVLTYFDGHYEWTAMDTENVSAVN